MVFLKFQFAKSLDAPVIHDLMVQAFMEYKDAKIPSSALEETVESITRALMDGENAIIAYAGEKPVGMARFNISENELYFYRLSVLPEEQGKGIAKKIVKALEEYARNKELLVIFCKVRMDVPRNIQLYRSLGFTVENEDVVHKPNGVYLKVVLMKKFL